MTGRGLQTPDMTPVEWEWEWGTGSFDSSSAPLTDAVLLVGRVALGSPCDPL